MPRTTQNPNGKSLWICEYCDKEFLYPSSLGEHRRIHTGERPFPCNLCSYSATKKTTLQNHIRRHLKEKLHKCPESNCNYSSVQPGNLKRHQLVHSQEKRFVCPHSSCSYKTGVKSNLTRHEEVHQADGDRDKRFACDLCPFKTTSRCQLQSHMTSIHSTEKRFKCAEEGCKFTCKTKSHLNKHVQIHGAKRLSCPSRNCEYRTNQKQDFERHLKIHLEDKRYKCRICSFATHHSSNLVVHMRTHTKEAPYKCGVEGCYYEAKQRSSLKSHVKSVHQRLRPFQCSFCDYAAAQKFHLKRHHITKHPDSTST